MKSADAPDPTDCVVSFVSWLLRIDVVYNL